MTTARFARIILLTSAICIRLLATASHKLSKVTISPISIYLYVHIYIYCIYIYNSPSLQANVSVAKNQHGNGLSVLMLQM